MVTVLAVAPRRPCKLNREQAGSPAACVPVILAQQFPAVQVPVIPARPADHRMPASSISFSAALALLSNVRSAIASRA
jgi:hypothetical protein